jgi:cytochrome c-type biogenesis protein CcmF
VRVHHKPLVNLIWLGCLLMAGGGFLAVLDGRYRRRSPATSVAARGPVGPQAGALPQPAVMSPKETAPT